MINKKNVELLTIGLILFPLTICGLGFLLQVFASFVFWDWLSFDFLFYRICFLSGFILGIVVVIEEWDSYGKT